MVTYSLIQNVPRKAIDYNAEDYCFEYSVDDQKDRASKRYELVYPPFFVRINGRYKPIIGKRYLSYYMEREIDVPYGLVIGGYKNDFELVAYIIQLKKEIDSFNAVEKSIALRRIYTFGKTVDPEILRLLEIPKNEKIVQHYLLLAEASNELKNLVCGGLLNEYTAFAIFKFDRDEWDDVARFASSLFLGTRKRNEIVNMIYDILLRDGKSPRAIIGSSEIVKISELKELDPPHKAERIYAYFERLRYPYIYKYKERFNRKLKEVGFAKKFHIFIPQNFERWEFKLTFPFSSAEAFRNNVKLLQEIGEKRTFSELMQMRY